MASVQKIHLLLAVWFRVVTDGRATDKERVMMAGGDVHLNSSRPEENVPEVLFIAVGIIGRVTATSTTGCFGHVIDTKDRGQTTRAHRCGVELKKSVNNSVISTHGRK